MLPSIFGENLFDDFFTDPFGMMVMPQRHDPLYGKHSKNLMKTDVRETEDSYELDVDLPGFKKDEISLDLKDGYLTISAEKMVTKIVCSLPFASSRISSFMLSPSFRSFL